MHGGYPVHMKMSEFNVIAFFLIILCFGIIHFLEYSSFLSRIAGVVSGAKVTSYTIQQTAFVMTRFFFVAMMPLIGFIVDSKIESDKYLIMIHLSLLLASFSYVLVIIFSKNIINYFYSVINRYQSGKSVFNAIILGFFYKNKEYIDYSVVGVISFILKDKECRNLVFGSAIVFCCYSIGVFVSFFAALYFFEFRSSIGQLSGVINALATVLLTFYIEPKVSNAIDKNDFNAKEKICSLLVGRFFGVAILSQLIIFSLWLI